MLLTQTVNAAQSKLFNSLLSCYFNMKLSPRSASKAAWGTWLLGVVKIPGMNWDELTGSLDGQGHDRGSRRKQNQLKPPQTPFKSLLNEQPVSGQTMNSHKVSDQKRNSTRPAENPAPRGEIRMMFTSSCLPNKCTTLENIHKLMLLERSFFPGILTLARLYSKAGTFGTSKVGKAGGQSAGVWQLWEGQGKLSKQTSWKLPNRKMTCFRELGTANPYYC